MRYLISGDEGFIGSNLRRYLESKGHAVLGIDRERGLHEDLTTMLGRTTLESGIAQSDLVFHLAGNANVSWCEANPTEAFQDVTNTLFLLEACKKLGRRVIVASSGMVYGRGVPDILPYIESRPTRPSSMYTVVKSAIESLCLGYPLATVVRFANVYGPGQDQAVTYKSTFLQDTIRKLLATDQDILLVNNPWHQRDYVYISDVVDAMEGLSRQGSLQPVYNLGSGVSMPNYSVAMIVRQATGYQGKVLPGREFPEDLPTLALDINRVLATGWSPQVSLWHGIQKVIHSI